MTQPANLPFTPAPVTAPATSTPPGAPSTATFTLTYAFAGPLSADAQQTLLDHLRTGLSLLAGEGLLTGDTWDGPALVTHSTAALDGSSVTHVLQGETPGDQQAVTVSFRPDSVFAFLGAPDGDVDQGCSLDLSRHGRASASIYTRDSELPTATYDLTRTAE